MAHEMEAAEWARARGLDVQIAPLSLGFEVRVRYPDRVAVMRFSDGYAARQGVPFADTLDRCLAEVLSSNATPSPDWAGADR